MALSSSYLCETKKPTLPTIGISANTVEDRVDFRASWKIGNTYGSYVQVETFNKVTIDLIQAGEVSMSYETLFNMFMPLSTSTTEGISLLNSGVEVDMSQFVITNLDDGLITIEGDFSEVSDIAYVGAFESIQAFNDHMGSGFYPLDSVKPLYIPCWKDLDTGEITDKTYAQLFLTGMDNLNGNKIVGDYGETAGEGFKLNIISRLISQAEPDTEMLKTLITYGFEIEDGTVQGKALTYPNSVVSVYAPSLLTRSNSCDSNIDSEVKYVDDILTNNMLTNGVTINQYGYLEIPEGTMSFDINVDMYNNPSDDEFDYEYVVSSYGHRTYNVTGGKITFTILDTVYEPPLYVESFSDAEGYEGDTVRHKITLNREVTEADIAGLGSVFSFYEYFETGANTASLLDVVFEEYDPVDALVYFNDTELEFSVGSSEVYIVISYLEDNNIEGEEVYQLGISKYVSDSEEMILATGTIKEIEMEELYVVSITDAEGLEGTRVGHTITLSRPVTAEDSADGNAGFNIGAYFDVDDAVNTASPSDVSIFQDYEPAGALLELEDDNIQFAVGTQEVTLLVDYFDENVDEENETYQIGIDKYAPGNIPDGEKQVTLYATGTILDKSVPKDCGYDMGCDEGLCEFISQSDITQFVGLTCDDENPVRIPCDTFGDYLNLQSGVFDTEDIVTNCRTYTNYSKTENYETQTLRYAACKNSLIEKPLAGTLEDFFVNKTCVGDIIYLTEIKSINGEDIIIKAKFRVLGRLSRDVNEGTGNKGIVTYTIDLIRASPWVTDCADLECDEVK